MLDKLQSQLQVSWSRTHTHAHTHPHCTCTYCSVRINTHAHIWSRPVEHLLSEATCICSHISKIRSVCHPSATYIHTLTAPLSRHFSSASIFLSALLSVSDSPLFLRSSTHLSIRLFLCPLFLTFSLSMPSEQVGPHPAGLSAMDLHPPAQDACQAAGVPGAAIPRAAPHTLR